MKTFFAILAAAVMATVANGAACDLTKLTPLLDDTNVKQCTADTGFQPPIPPTAEMMPKVCKSDACGAALKTLKALGLGDCTVASTALETNLIGPIEKACGGSGAATPTTTAPAAGGANTTAPATIKPSTNGREPTTAPTTTTTEPATKVPSSGATTAPTTELTPTVTPSSLTPTSCSTSASEGSSSDLVPIVTSCVAGVLVVAFVMFFIVWKKRRSAAKTTTTNGGTDFTAGTKTSIGAFSAAVALWNDRHLLAVRIDADDIQDMKKFGSGAFCDVWLVTYRRTRQAASKRLREVTLSRTEQFIDEIKLVATLKHPNIVVFIGAAWTQEADLQALFEFMDGGDLRNYLQDPYVPREWTTQKLQFAIDVAEALVFVHSFNPPLVHRDLKSRNVLLGNTNFDDNNCDNNNCDNDDNNNDGLLRAKLTDFGVSRYRSEDNTMTSGVGTSKWLAPEVILSDGTYGPAADIYSFGVVLSELDTHKLPYDDVRGPNGNPLADVAMLQLVASGELRPSFLPTCPLHILELAQRCLSLQPTKRPTAMELAYALRSYKKDLRTRGYTNV